MGKPLKVAFLVTQNGFGGGEVNVQSLMARLDRSVIEPLLLAPPDNPLVKQARAAGWRYMPLRPAPFLSTSSEWRGRKFLNPFSCITDVALLPIYTAYLERELRQAGVDAVQTNSIFAHLCGGQAARRLGIACIWQLGDIVSPRLGFGLPNRLCRWLAAQQSAVVVPSQAVSRAYGDAANVSVIHNGVDVDAYVHAEGDAVRTEFNIPPAAPLITIVGRLTRWKGQATFIAAAARLRCEFPGARFLIVGAAEFEADDYAEELRQQAASLGLGDCLTFTGRRSDVAAILKASDVVAHCSLKPEPFGLVIIEAMAAAKPVVASNLGGPLEIISDSEDGLLVAAGEAARLAQAIATLLHNPGAAWQMGQRAQRKVARHFSIENFVARFTALYCTVMAQEQGFSEGGIYPARIGVMTQRGGNEHEDTLYPQLSNQIRTD